MGTHRNDWQLGTGIHIGRCNDVDGETYSVETSDDEEDLVLGTYSQSSESGKITPKIELTT